MTKHILDSAGWLLDEADADEFWGQVYFYGGEEYLQDPLVDKAKVSGDCWEWRGAKSNGYGRPTFWGRRHLAHRIAFRDFGNKLSDDLVLDHLCRNRACVNPSHLEPVSMAVNIQRGSTPLKNRETCNNGHPTSDENVIMRKSHGKLIASCKVCRAERKKREYQAKKARLASA